MPPSDDIFDRFRYHVQENQVTGLEAQGKQASYIPISKLRDYWTRSHVSEVVHATDCQVPIDDIRTQYLQTFSILVWISRTGRPYLHYLNIFNRHERGDASLPIQERPGFLPSSNDADDLWTTFHKHQWIFCPVVLGPRRLHDRRLHQQQILPLQIVKRLGHVKDGKPARIELAKLQSPTELNPSNHSQDHVVLKSYPYRADRIYRNEFKAFTALQNAPPCENILRYLGSFHSTTENGITYTIILEYANKGTLLDMYRRNQPPVTFEEVKTFWSGILKIAKALMAVQYTLDGKVANKCIHQDVKPSNIFAFSCEEDTSEDYKATFKIGDFGESSVMRSDPYSQTSRGRDNRSSRTYCPPELHWNDEVDFPVNPLVDIWSLGCVLIETALWVTSGERARIAFQQRRRDENGRVSPIQRGLGRSDCFHNGKDRLQTVSDVYDFIKRHGRRSDGLTPDIVLFVLNRVLVEKRERYNARLLATELDNLIRKSTETVYGSSVCGSIASSADLSQRSRERSSIHGNEYGESYRMSMGPLSTGEQARNTAYRADMLSPDRSPPTLHLLGTSPSYHECTRASGIDIDGDPKAEPWNHHDAVQRPPICNTVSLPEASLLPTAEDCHQARQQEATLMGIHGAAGPSQRLERKDGISSIDEETYMGDTRHSHGQTLRPSRPQMDAQSHARIDPSPCQWSTKRVETDKSSDSKATITLTTQRDKTHAPRPSRPTFPHVRIADVNERRIKEKETGLRRSLPGEDQAMALLKSRDHIFLIDNSRSMQQHKKEVIETLINLSHILEKADEDGLDVICASDWERKEHHRRAESLVAYVENNFYKGGDSCFIEKSLLSLTTKIITDLPSNVARPSRNFFMSRLGRKNRGRPTSIYVLTNGVWNPSAAARDGVCGADNPIRQLMRELRDRNLHRSQVSLQFIRFGNDATGIRRLTSLDDDLGQEFPGFDIVDHKDSTGGVWPMLVGSLDESVDRESGSEDDNT